MTEDIRAKILAEALREIDRHGSEFHMDDLARKLRISKRTLYEYFSSKQEIVEEAISSFLERVYQYHRELVDDDNLTCEEKLIAYFDVPNENWQVLSVRKVCDLLVKMPDVWERLQSRYKKDWSLLEQLLDEALSRQENSSLLTSSCYCACCTAQPMISSIISMMSIKIPVLVII